MYFLGMDVSTTATKALIADEAGRVVGSAASEYAFETPRPLWSEQQPDLWWQGARQAIRAVLEKTGIPNNEIATATDNSKKFDAPIIPAGAATS